VEHRPAKLKCTVSVRAYHFWNAKVARECPRLLIERALHAAGVEHFDAVQKRRQALQGARLPVGAAVRIERMRHADERLLSAQPAHNFHGFQSRRDFFAQKITQNLSLGGLNFFSHDNLLRRKLVRLQRAFQPVVVGHCHLVNSLFTAGQEQRLDFHQTVRGIARMAVKFSADKACVHSR